MHRRIAEGAYEHIVVGPGSAQIIPYFPFDEKLPRASRSLQEELKKTATLSAGACFPDE